MAEADIPVDLLNPGQVFACLGFVEAAEVLLGDATGGFDWSDPRGVTSRICRIVAATSVAPSAEMRGSVATVMARVISAACR